MEEEKKEVEVKEETEENKEQSTQEEARFIGMDKNICFGLSWLIFPIGIVALAVDHQKMNQEEKQQIVSIFVMEGATIAVSIVCSIFTAIFNAIGVYFLGGLFSFVSWAVSIAIFVVAIIAAVKAFKKNYWNVPVAYDLAAKFMKK